MKAIGGGGRTTMAAALTLGVAATATAFVLTGGSGAGAASLAAGSAGGASSVTVSGTGAASGAPDVLRVTFGITKKAGDVSAAIEGSNAGVRKVRDALRADGVAARDIRTQDFNVDSDYDENGEPKPGVYVATQSVSVTLRNLAKAGRAISDAARTGGNATRIYSVSYDIEDRAKLLAKARDAAFADAKAKATRYAELAGRPLGQAREVTEGQPDTDMPEIAYAADKAAAAAPSDVPLSAGSQSVTVSNTVVWDLG